MITHSKNTPPADKEIENRISKYYTQLNAGLKDENIRHTNAAQSFREPLFWLDSATTGRNGQIFEMERLKKKHGDHFCYLAIHNDIEVLSL